MNSFPLLLQHRLSSLPLLALLVGAASGCEATTGPDPGKRRLEISDLPESLQEFAADQTTPPIWTFKRPARVAVDTFVFFLQWGPPEDCPSGCIYLGAYGLNLGDRIGWLTEALYFTASPPRYFRFLPGDSLAIRPEFLERIRKEEPRAYDDMRFRACCDVNTDEGLLFRIARQISPFGSRRHAQALLENPTAIRSERILGVLAALEGSEYVDERGRAMIALNRLKNGLDLPPPDTVIGGPCGWYDPM